MERNTNDQQITELKGDIKHLSANLVEFKAEQKESLAEIKVTLRDLAGVYTTKEQHNALIDKVDTIRNLLYGTLTAVALEALHLLSQYIGRK